MWLARNKDVTLILYPDFGMLERDGEVWRYYTFSNIIKPNECFGRIIDSKLFPALKWEDEPIVVKLFETKKLYERVSEIVTKYDDNAHPTTEYIEELILAKNINDYD